MKKLWSAVTLFLMSSWVYAAGAELDRAADAPVETVDVVYVILFAVIFFGMIAGFFIQLWRNERRKAHDE